MKVRFIVSRETRWAGTDSRRYFLRPLSPEDQGQDAPEHEGDPVGDLLYEVASDAIPREFGFPRGDKDATPGSAVWNDEGIEIQVDETQHYLAVGNVVDMGIAVVGQAKLS